MTETKTPAKKPRFSTKWHTIFWACFALAMFIIDLSSKWIVQSLVKPGDANMVAIIPNFLYVNLSYNTKIAFSLGIDNVFGRILNIAISLIMSGVIIAYYVVKRNELSPFIKATLALLGAGAVGNLIDRAFYWSGTVGFDGVVDFIQFYLGGGPGAATSVVNPFATFNWADSCLTIGVIMFIVYLIADSVKHSGEDHTKPGEVVEVDPTRSNAAKKEAPAETKENEKPDDK